MAASASLWNETCVHKVLAIKNNSIGKEESWELYHALNTYVTSSLRMHAGITTGQVVLLSDALSVLQSTKSSSNKEVDALTTALVALNSAAQTVVIQWVPATDLKITG